MQLLKSPSPRQVTCPSCGHGAAYSQDNPYRPFCSRRCKLVDLGQWASEGYRVPDAAAQTEETDA